MVDKTTLHGFGRLSLLFQNGRLVRSMAIMRYGDMLALYTNWHGIQLVNDKSTDYQGCWVAYMLTQWPVYMAWDVDQTRSQLVHIILHVNYWTYSPAHMACQLGLTGPRGTTCQLIRLIHEGQWFAWMGNVLLKDVGHQTKQQQQGR